MKHDFASLSALIQMKTDIAILTDIGVLYHVMGRHADYARGCFYSKNDIDIIIVADGYLLSPSSDLGFVSTLLHELVHATANAKICNRIRPCVSDGLAHREYAMEECIAEYTAQLLMKYFGLITNQIEEQSNDYIDFYFKNCIGDYETIVSKSNQAFDWLISNIFSEKIDKIAA